MGLGLSASFGGFRVEEKVVMVLGLQVLDGLKADV